MGDGDPHIHSLRGAHYTLLRQGNFLAWNFSKAQEGVHFELFASYGGPDFSTQALLLKSGAETMEFTAKDWDVYGKSEHYNDQKKKRHDLQ